MSIGVASRIHSIEINNQSASCVIVTEDVNVSGDSASECEAAQEESNDQQSAEESSDESSDESTDESCDKSSESEKEEDDISKMKPSKVQRYIHGNGTWNESSSDDCSQEEDSVDDVPFGHPAKDGSKSNRRGKSFTPRTADGIPLKVTGIVDSDDDAKVETRKMSEMIDDILSDDIVLKPKTDQKQKTSKTKVESSTDNSDSTETGSDEESDSELERAIGDILDSGTE